MNITDVKSRLKYYYFIPLNQLESELKNLHSYTRLEKFLILTQMAAPFLEKVLSLYLNLYLFHHII